MNSNSKSQITALVKKEVISEFRGRSGLLTGLLFSLIIVIAIAYSTQQDEIRGRLASGLLWVTLLFCSIVILPRIFIAEEEQGTADLLRLLAEPKSVFWGKLLFNLVVMLVSAIILSGFFIFLLHLTLINIWLYLLSLLFGCAAIASAVTLSGAIVAQASNRGVLVGAIAMPLLLPLTALLIASTKAALGDGLVELSWQATLGLFCYSVASVSFGPLIFDKIWRN